MIVSAYPSLFAISSLQRGFYVDNDTAIYEFRKKLILMTYRGSKRRFMKGYPLEHTYIFFLYVCPYE